MSDARATSIVQDALRRLGFESYAGEDGHTVFRHLPSDTIFLFHKHGPAVLPPMRVDSIRRLAVGRGAATEQALDRAMVAAVSAATKRSNGHRRTPAKAG